jgi:small nuclear ribonucleoprotein (snRNP)-like protein
MSGTNRGGTGGRVPIGGRSLVDPHQIISNHTVVSRTSTPPISTPVSFHQQSGVPFGHVPAYLPGSASLVEELDSRILIVLRDGKHIVGVSTTVWYDFWDFRQKVHTGHHTSLFSECFLIYFRHYNVEYLHYGTLIRRLLLNFPVCVFFWKQQTLVSFDQFSNMVLSAAVERRICYHPLDRILYYTDVPLGLYVVRGDSTVLSGPLSPDHDDPMNSNNNNQLSHSKCVSLAEYEMLCQNNKAQPPLKWDFDEDLTAWRQRRCIASSWSKNMEPDS